MDQNEPTDNGIIYHNQELPSIPEKSVAGWKDILVDENDPRFQERLVPIGAFSDFDDCDTSAVYFGERGEKPEDINFLGRPVDRENSLITHFVREGVLERLKIAQSMLPKGYYFLFYDTFRPLNVQQALYDTQKEKLKEENSNWSEEQLEIEAQKFVSIPAPNEKTGAKHPSPHSTGGVIDLTIVKMSQKGEAALQDLETRRLGRSLNYPASDGSQNMSSLSVQGSLLKKAIYKQYAEPLDMGTKFDEFTDVAGTTFYEKEATKRQLTLEEQEVLQNRRFLYQVMTCAGFENYGEEWWHFNYGDNMWAKLSGHEKAFYGGFAELPSYCRDFENKRRAVYDQEMNIL